MALFFNAQSRHFQPIHRKPFICSVKRTNHFSQVCEPQDSQASTETLPSDHGLIVVGGSKLSGHVNISGSKNSALAVLAGTLCCSRTSKLHNIPDISDTREMFLLLQSLGVRVEASNGEVTVDTDGIRSVEPCPDSVRKTRGGFFVLGPLLTRFGEAVVALPGGCDIGTRPIDLYIRGLRALGAVVELRSCNYNQPASSGWYWTVNLEYKAQQSLCICCDGRGLVGGKFHLDYPSVGATETLMMAASMADGVTMLSNVAQDSEMVDLAQFLNKSGACVEGVGSGTFVIKGRNRLHGPEFTIIPDRIEISALPRDITGDIRCVNVKTGPFPQFPTDLPPQIMALLMTCNGSSIVEESVFDKRMRHGLQHLFLLKHDELLLSFICSSERATELGGRIQVCGNTAFINGKDHGSALYGAPVVATDLRGGAALILAGMAVEGTTQIDGVAQIDRGYQNLDMTMGNQDDILSN